MAEGLVRARHAFMSSARTHTHAYAHTHTHTHTHIHTHTHLHELGSLLVEGVYGIWLKKGEEVCVCVRAEKKVGKKEIAFMSSAASLLRGSWGFGSRKRKKSPLITAPMSSTCVCMCVCVFMYVYVCIIHTYIHVTS
jgi:hypothetical protein